MKKFKLSFLGLCLAAISAQAQVVYSENEQNYVANMTTTHSSLVSTHTEVQPSFQKASFKLSKIQDNWFASAKMGASAFIGTPQGCSDLLDRVTPSAQFSLGKWHSPYFGTRFGFQGLEMKGADLIKQKYQAYHGDLMLNLSSIHRQDYTTMPRWNLVPYVGAGAIHNKTLRKTAFSLHYGLECNYRFAARLYLTAELGGLSTSKNFDGTGQGHQLGDHIIHASLGLIVGIGNQGWEKKKLKSMPYYTPMETRENSFYPKNDYRGLRQLKKRMNSVTNSESVTHAEGFDAPILFFFKINTTHLIDTQQKVNIAEIAAAVKEYDLKVKIIGAADSRTGSPSFNRKLSVKRAKYIAKLLMQAGVPKEKMSGISQGGIDIYQPYTANRHTCVILQKEVEH